jgi:signal peptidase II
LAKTHGLRWIHLLVALAAIALDRITKNLIENLLPSGSDITVIPGFFQITHVHNRGAAFGLFSESTSEWRSVLLIGFSVLALAVIAYLLWKSDHTLPTTAYGLSLILGGAIGNLWDRIVHGQVTDFLHFYIGSYVWPDFNVADSCIVIGAVMLMIEIVFAKPPAKGPSTHSTAVPPCAPTRRG